MLTEKLAVSFPAVAQPTLSRCVRSACPCAHSPGFQPDSLSVFSVFCLQQQTTFRAQSVAFQHCVALLPFAYNLLLLVCCNSIPYLVPRTSCTPFPRPAVSLPCFVFAAYKIFAQTTNEMKTESETETEKNEHDNGIRH